MEIWVRKLPCTNCGKDLEVDIRDYERPSGLEMLIEGDVNLETCSHCGYRNLVICECSFHVDDGFNSVES